MAPSTGYRRRLLEGRVMKRLTGAILRRARREFRRHPTPANHRALCAARLEASTMGSP